MAVNCLTGHGQTTDAVHEAGVSRELAQLRKQKVKDLRYDLRFSIPRDKHAPVTGEGLIRFRLDAPTEIVIDFREAEEKIAEVRVNGKTASYTFRNEHIILPATLTQAGENAISVRFTAGDQSLNRNDDFLYSLSVPDRARTIFPCFDQPNLKAVFTLTLELPAEWVGVSNTRVTKEEKQADRKTLHFAPTRPLSTYLFAFAAGRFEQRTYHGEGRTLTAYYRETDPQKVAQLDTIFRQSAAALDWLEAYTGMPCPFDKQDFIILPGFQFGGMEHVGATLYNDTQLFLGPNPTPDEELRRIQLIAHETAHAWFGNLVTMDWFDDVWTKEVFANHFSAWITEPLFPSVNHKLQRMRTFFASALSEDRTPGTNAIHQELDNLRNAGLIYGQIIYNKAPVVMGKIIELMGEDAFREGIREYLRTYAYSNATWDDLIRILDRHTPEDLIAFNDAWVNRKGMPIIRFTPRGKTLEIRQKDRYAPGIVRPQRFAVTLATKGQTDTTLEVNLRDSLVRLTLPFAPERVLPNTDGRAYGLLIPDSASRDWLLAHWHEATDETTRLARLMLLHENYQACLIPDALWLDALMNGLRTEANPLLFSTITSYISTPLRALPSALREGLEDSLLRLSASHPQRSSRQRLLRMLIHSAASPATLARLYTIWRDRSEPLLNETDYTDLAYSLAVRLPDRSDSIVRTQRARLTDPDRIRRFDFISRAMTPDTVALDTLFRSLLIPENRRIEPWTSALLGWLNHPTRERHAVRYIRPALDALRDVQRTGDIFFPRDWVGALLRNHRSPEAYRALLDFIDANPGYPPLLLNKVWQAAYPLYRANGEVEEVENEK